MNPKGTFLFIANDKWFDYKKLIEDTNGEYWWFHSPKKVIKGSTVFLYLSGGTKAVKYELVVLEVGKTHADVNIDYFKYVDPSSGMTEMVISPDKKVLKLKVVREIKDLSKTSPKMLKSDGNVLGSLMSNRELRPYSIEYLSKCK